MSNITTTNNTDIATGRMALMKTDAERNTLALMDAQKAHTVNIEQFVKLIAEVYAYKGMQPVDADIAYQAQMLKAECSQYFKSLTYPELRNAIFNALRGEYGQMFGLNVAEYHKAIKSYLNDTKTLEAKKTVLQRLNIPAEPLLTDAQKEAIMVDAFARVKADVLAGKSLLNDTGAIGVYNWLKKAGKLKGILNEIEIAQIKEQAEDILKNQYAAKAESMDRNTRATAKDMIKKLTDGLLPNELTVVCQKLALEKLIKENKL